MKANSVFLAFVSITTLLANLRAQTTLKNAFYDDFRVGAAVNESVFEQTDQRAAAIVKTQFNSITSEDALKWDAVHPEPTNYDFKAADAFVDFGQRNHMFIVGHILIWHHQTPDWVFLDNNGHRITRSALLSRMHDHIATVVGRYKGKVSGWDVVGEVLNEDGSMHRSEWMKIIGPDYIAKAYQFAHEADPDAQLYYTDFNLNKPEKRAATVALIKKLRTEGIPITAVGYEGHGTLGWPTTNSIDLTIKDLAATGIKVMISELDVDVQPQITISQSEQAATNAVLRAQWSLYTNGLPDSVQMALAKRYADLFKVFLANRKSITRVTFWGVTDGQSWLNKWPIQGRTSYPLIFDRNYQPKSAFDAILKVAQEQIETAKAQSSPP